PTSATCSPAGATATWNSCRRDSPPNWSRRSNGRGSGSCRRRRLTSPTRVVIPGSKALRGGIDSSTICEGPGQARRCSRRRSRYWFFGIHCFSARPPLLGGVVRPCCSDVKGTPMEFFCVFFVVVVVIGACVTGYQLNARSEAKHAYLESL